MISVFFGTIALVSIFLPLALFRSPSSIAERGFLSRKIELPKDRSHWLVTLLFIVFAYGLSVSVRYTWIDYAEAHYLDESGEKKFFRPQMVRDGVALPNTHDSFYFGSILQKALYDRHQDNHLIPGVYTNGMITYLPYALLKLFPDAWTIEELLLKIPVWTAGLVCMPIVLIGRLYGSSLWGFFAACLAGVAHSYYNRTLAGYYDTDMFSITVPALAFFFLLAASRKESLGYLTAAALTLYLSRFFYGSIQAITCALCLSFVFYRLLVFILEILDAKVGKNKQSTPKNFLPFLLGLSSLRFTSLSVLFISWVLYAESWSSGKVIEENMGWFSIGLLVPVILFLLAGFKRSPEPSASLESKPTEVSGDEKVTGKDDTPPRVHLVSNFIWSLPAALVILALFIGVAPFIDAGPFSGTWSKLTGKLQSYSSSRGAGATISGSTGYTLNFLDVKSTIREAGSLDQNSKRINDIRMRNRILEDLPLWRADLFDENPSLAPPPDPGSKYKWFNPFEKNYPKYASDLNLKTALLAFVGYLLLCVRYWEFFIGAPFWFIGYNCFSHFVDRPLGLRFTVHVGNVASIGLVFLLLVITWLFFRWLSSKVGQGDLKPKLRKLFMIASWSVVAVFVVLFAWPNYEHAKGYYSHVVYPVKTIEVLEKLNEASQPDDFVVTWWDYGSGCWFYGDARTFTSPAHQSLDNFLTSEILRSNSQVKAANLARLKTETFVRLQEERNSEEKRGTGKSVMDTAVQEIFKDGSSDLVFYQGLLERMKESEVSLPRKSRDVFLFLPYEILRIFPTILSFSSRNLYFPSSSGSAGNESPMTILRNGKREGFSLVFDGGYRMDSEGVLFFRNGGRSLEISYGQFLEVKENGSPAVAVNAIDAAGLKISAKLSPTAPRSIVFVKEKNEMVILSRGTYQSTFAKRFLLDQFDLNAYESPLFAGAANPRNSPFMLKADGVQILSGGSQIILRTRGGYQIKADLSNGLANVTNVKDAVPFAFHRCMHDKTTGQMIKSPRTGPMDARFHLIQTNLPAFRGQPTYKVPEPGQTLAYIAEINGLKPSALSSYLGLAENYSYSPGALIKMPGKGYDLYQSWFFMDEAAFKSTLVQGFLMESLDPTIFEKITSSPWGKVYKILR